MKPSNEKWNNAKDEFFLFLKAEKEPKTIKDYTLKIEKAEKYFKETFGYIPDPRTITDKDAAGYLYWVKNQDWDRNYYRRIFRVFAQFLAYSMNPYAFRIQKMTPKEVPKPVDYYSLAEVKKALEMFKEEPFEELKLRTLIWIYAWTGIRYFEGITLKYRDIDLQKNHIIIEEGKGGKSRFVYIPEVLKPLLVKYLEMWKKHMKLRNDLGMQTSEYLFFWVKRNGEIFEPTKDFRGYFMKVRRRAEEVEIKNFNIKKFRSTMTKILREIGEIELEKVSAQLGHSKTETTEEYYHRMGPVGLEPGYKKVAWILLDGKKEGESDGKQ